MPFMPTLQASLRKIHATYNLITIKQLEHHHHHSSALKKNLTNDSLF